MIKKVISIILILLMFTSLTVYAGNIKGGDADVGGDNTDIGNTSGKTSSDDKMLWSQNYPSGMKLSLLFIGKGNYEPALAEDREPALKTKTPTSIIGSGKPSEWDAGKPTEGNWGIAPIYFIKGGIEDDREIGFTSTVNTTNAIDNFGVIEGKTKSNIVKNEDEVINAASQVEATPDIGQSIFKAFNQPANGPVSDIQEYLHMKRWNDPTYNASVDGKKNKDILNTIIELMKAKHPELSTVLDQAKTYDNDYTILIEPITTVKKEGTEDYYLITPTAFQHAFLGTGNLSGYASNSIWNSKSIDDFMINFNPGGQDIKGLWLSYSSRPILGRKNHAGGASSRTDIPMEDIKGDKITNPRQSIASKVAYAGPILKRETETGDEHRATFQNYHWGWGCLASPDFVQDTKFVVLSSGFMDKQPNTVATIDFVEVDGYLTGLLATVRETAEHHILKSGGELEFTDYYDTNDLGGKDIALEECENMFGKLYK